MTEQPTHSVGGTGALSGMLGSGSDFSRMGTAAVESLIQGGKRNVEQTAPASPAAPTKTILYATPADAKSLPVVAPRSPEPAEISAAASIPNAFSMDVECGVLSRMGRIEFGVFQRAVRNDGYRLAIETTAHTAVVEVRRLTPSSVETLDRRTLSLRTIDPRAWRIVWVRDTDGRMNVDIDGRRVLTTRIDQRFRDPFNGVTIVNEMGSLAVSRIEVTGAQ